MSDVAIAEAGQADHANDQAWWQYVTFAVGQRQYAVEITKVREIKAWSEPTELPNSPHAMRGVLNLRGVIVPIFDLRAQFGEGTTDAHAENVVIIVMLRNRLIGVLVDAVSDILTLEPDDILPVPITESESQRSYLAGLVSHEERMVALLKLEELFGIETVQEKLCA